MKDVGAGRRRRISRRLIGHWPHNGRAQQQDSSWKPLGAAEGTKGGCRRAWTACGRSHGEAAIERVAERPAT